ncbi:MAG: helical backbone metal receptor, partial [Polyangiaceae bacterium]
FSRCVRCRPVAWLALLALCLSSLACKGEPRPAAAKEAMRVVSLSPSTTEVLFAVGAGDKLVGRSQQCDYPVDARRLPSVGGFADPNVEAVLGLRPSLVVGARGPAGPQLQRRLHEHGIATFFPPATSVRAVGDLIVTLGEKVGRGAAALEVRRQMDDRVAELTGWVATKSPVRVVMVFDHRPIYVAGPVGFVSELLALAGGHNVVQKGGSYPALPIERLLTLDPDVIIDAVTPGDTKPGPSALAKVAGWSELRAVKEGRLRRLRSSTPLRPGPRLAEGLAELVRVVHGREPPR